MSRLARSDVAWPTGVALVVALGLPGCLLTNIDAEPCGSDDACVLGFGLGSQCEADGFCTEPATCDSPAQCRQLFGGGACAVGRCVDVLPISPQCPVYEPADLAGRRLTGPSAPVVVGAMYALEEESDTAQLSAARLAVREIDRSGGLVAGRELAIVGCDIGGPGNTAAGEDRKALVRGALDHLAGVLGVPAIIGPTTSGDSLTAIGHEVSRGYATVIVSASATSPALTTEPDRLDPADPYGLFWRTVPSDELQGRVLAEDVIGFIPAPAVIDRVAVVFVQDSYGQGLANVVQTSLGVSRTSLFPYDAASDFTTLAQQVAASNPDGVLIVAVRATDTVALLGPMSTTNLTTKQFYFTDGSKEATVLLDPALPQPVKDIILAAVGTAPASPMGASFDQFNASLQKDFGLDATQWSFLANAYDAGYVVGYGTVFAMQQLAAFDGRGVAEGLSRLSAGQSVQVGPNAWSSAKLALTSGQSIDIVGTSGALDFDAATGEAPGPIEVWQANADFSGFHVVQVVSP